MNAAADRWANMEAGGFRRVGGLTTDDYARLGFAEFMARYYEETGIRLGGDAPPDAYDDPEIVWTWRPARPSGKPEEL